MARFGFCGPSYPSYSPNVDAERCINYYPENVEGNGKTAVAMYPRPGLKTFATITGSSVRCTYAFNGRLFAVGDNFNEIHQDGSVTAYTFLTVDSRPVTMAANSANQLIICSGGELWLFSLTTSPSLPFAIQSIQVFAGVVGRGPYAQINLGAATPFPLGTLVTFSGITDSSLLFLNGQSVIVGNFNDFYFTCYPSGITTDYTSSTNVGDVSSAGTGQQFLHVNIGGGPFTFIDFVDEYFIALIENSQEFQISALNDGTSWSGLDINRVSVFADNTPSLLVDHREVWLFGNKKSIVYYNTGNANNPLQPVPNGIIEQGIIAPQSAARIDNSVFWLGGDERGIGICWRANGYTPVRISNHATEQVWRTYATTTDAVAWTYQDGGHTFYCLWFPTGNATWVYDAATQQWHERTWLKPSDSSVNAWLPRCHAENWGYHLVGDRQSGVIYAMAQSLPDDNGNPIQFIRRAPDISAEDQWIPHVSLQVILETGINAVTPQVNLRYSNDNAHTWSSYKQKSGGALGQYRYRVIWRRLGRSRNRVYEFSTTTPLRIVDAYLNAPAGGYSPSPRLGDQIRKSA